MADLRKRVGGLREQVLNARHNLSERDVDALLDQAYELLYQAERDRPGPIRTVVRLLRAGVCEMELAALPHRRKAFTLLGVTPSTDADEIKRRYYRLALQFHPDRNPDSPERIRELNEAWALVRRMKGIRQ